MADKGDAARAARASAGLAQLERLLGAAGEVSSLVRPLFGRGGRTTSAPQLRAAVSRLTAAIAQSLGLDSSSDDDVVPQPPDTDPGALAQFFDDPAHVRPRRGCEYADTPGFAPLKEGKLSKLSPRGLYLIHLLYCEPCRGAERVGTFCAHCPHKIHVWCALTEGFWLNWAAGSPPPPGSPQLFSDSKLARYPAGSPDPVVQQLRAASIAEFAKYEGQGVFVPLSDAQRRDLNSCASVCRSRIAVKAKVRLPSEISAHIEQNGGKFDPAVVCLAAQRDALEDAGRFAAAAASNRSTKSFNDYEALRLAATAQRFEPEPKFCIVTGFDRTLNPYLASTSLSYGTISDLACSLTPQVPCSYFINDGSAAYYQTQPSAETQPYLVVQHPAFPDRYYYINGGPMGLSIMCLIFAGIMAIFRLALASSPAALVGDVHVTGLLDDTGQEVADRALPAQVAWTRLICCAIVYLTNDKEQVGKLVEYLGATVEANTNTAVMKPKKLYQLQHSIAFLRALCELSTDDNPCFVDIEFLRSTLGDVNWLAQFDYVTRIHCGGLYAALSIAERKGYSDVLLRRSSPAYEDLVYLTERAAQGKLRSSRFFPATDVSVCLQPLPNTVAARPQEEVCLAQAVQQLQLERLHDAEVAAAARDLLQAMPVQKGQSNSHRQVVGLASDASKQPEEGHSAWAVTDGSSVYYSNVSGDQRHLTSSDLELSTVGPYFRANAEQLRRKIVFIGTDSLVTMFRLNKGKAARGTYAYAMLQFIYEVADEYDIDFVAVWIPRSANQFVDRLSKCRTADEARAWAESVGLRFYRC